MASGSVLKAKPLGSAGYWRRGVKDDSKVFGLQSQRRVKSVCREHFTPQAESGRGGQRLGKSSQ